MSDWVLESCCFWLRSNGRETKRYSHKILSMIWRCLFGSFAWLSAYWRAASFAPANIAFYGMPGPAEPTPPGPNWPFCPVIALPL